MASKERIVVIAACVVTVVVVVALVASEMGKQQPIEMKTRAESIPTRAPTVFLWSVPQDPRLTAKQQVELDSEVAPIG